MSKCAQRALTWMAATAVLSVAIHYATIHWYPTLYMSSCLRQLVARVGMHQFVHASPPTWDNRETTCLPSPDLIYSAAAFDLSAGPLRVTVPVAGPYTSVSLYAANTDNFFVTNDRHVPRDKFDFILVGPATPDPGAAGIPVIRAPSTTGGILVRFFVGDRDDLNTIESVRRQMGCSVLK